MFFDNLDGLARVVVASVVAYLGLVLILRISGKRSLAKLNAFDFVVTVAFGSTLATIILSKDVPLAEGLLALVMLAALQYLVSSVSVRFTLVKGAVRSNPTRLVRDGIFLKAELHRQRVTQSDVEAAIRKEGIGRVEEVAAVVLETDGSFSVIRLTDGEPLSALRDVWESDSGVLQSTVLDSDGLPETGTQHSAAKEKINAD